MVQFSLREGLSLSSGTLSLSRGEEDKKTKGRKSQGVRAGVDLGQEKRWAAGEGGRDGLEGEMGQRERERPRVRVCLFYFKILSPLFYFRKIFCN
jgi:hypothetical protein